MGYAVKHPLKQIYGQHLAQLFVSTLQIPSVSLHDVLEYLGELSKNTETQLPSVVAAYDYLLILSASLSYT